MMGATPMLFRKKVFFLRHRELFETRDENMEVTHSNKNNTEISNEIVVNGLIQCGSHRYRSNFAVANCRYDVLLGMPWHIDVQPRIDYGIPEVEVADKFLPLERNQCSRVSISNIGVKKFRSLLRKKGHQEDFEVFGLIEDDSNRLSKRGTNGRQQRNRLDALLVKHKSIFREELPDGLPPERSIDHGIELEPHHRPPKHPLYQLSLAELVAVKEYVINLLKKGKIRRSRSPYGASLFFVKHKGKLRAVVDYRALKRLTKRNNTPLPRTDEMFDRLGEATVFSKIYLKTGFHQIRLKPEDVEKTAFNTKYGLWYLCLYTHSPHVTLVPRILRAQDYVSRTRVCPVQCT